MFLAHIITDADVGSAVIDKRRSCFRCGYNTGTVIPTDFMGGIIEHDIGKRIYFAALNSANQYTYQVETDEQFKERTERRQYANPSSKSTDTRRKVVPGRPSLYSRPSW